MTCLECKGRGYLLSQEYGEAEIPEGWEPVQACDNCRVLADDEVAAANAATDHGTCYRYFTAGTEGEPGDYAIKLDYQMGQTAPSTTRRAGS